MFTNSNIVSFHSFRDCFFCWCHFSHQTGHFYWADEKSSFQCFFGIASDKFCVFNPFFRFFFQIFNWRMSCEIMGTKQRNVHKRKKTICHFLAQTNSSRVNCALLLRFLTNSWLPVILWCFDVDTDKEFISWSYGPQARKLERKKTTIPPRGLVDTFFSQKLSTFGHKMYFLCPDSTFNVHEPTFDVFKLVCNENSAVFVNKIQNFETIVEKKCWNFVFC